MFTPDSRYAAQPTYLVTLADGTQVTAVTPPTPAPAPIIGYHPAAGGQRLDLVAVQYLNAPTGVLAAVRCRQRDAPGGARRARPDRDPPGGEDMSVSIQLALDGTPLPDSFYTAISRLEVEESADEPGALLLRVPTNPTSAGDLQFVGDGTFEPLTNVTLTVTAGAQGATPQCVFDGYALSWRLRLDRTGSASTLEVWAHDASWLMNLDDSIVEWSGQTDGEIANAIFATYGFTPADGNTDNDSPSHTPDGHTLFQRGTDLQFLRGLARPRRQGVPGRLHRHRRGSHRVLRRPRPQRLRPRRRSHSSTPTAGRSIHSCSTGT